MADKKKKGYEDAIRDMMDFVESQKSDAAGALRGEVPTPSKREIDHPFLQQVRAAVEELTGKTPPSTEKKRTPLPQPEGGKAYATKDGKYLRDGKGRLIEIPEPKEVTKGASIQEISDSLGLTRPVKTESKKGGGLGVSPLAHALSLSQGSAPDNGEEEDGLYTVDEKGKETRVPGGAVRIVNPEPEERDGLYTVDKDGNETFVPGGAVNDEDGLYTVDKDGNETRVPGGAVRIVKPEPEAPTTHKTGTRASSPAAQVLSLLQGATPNQAPPDEEELTPLPVLKKGWPENPKMSPIQVKPMQFGTSPQPDVGIEPQGPVDQYIGKMKEEAGLVGDTLSTMGRGVRSGLEAGDNAMAAGLNGLDRAGNFIGNVLSPESAPPVTLADPVDEGTTRPSNPAMAPKAPPDIPATAPVAVPPPGKQSNSLSMGLKTKTPGAVPPSTDDWGDEAMKKGLLAERDAALKRSEVETAANKQLLDAQKQTYDEAVAFQAKRTAAEAQLSTAMQQHEAGLNNLQQQVLEAGKMQVDPGRYWANKTDGQKAAAVIAGALFGFTGQGMQWLQRLDSLVESDVKMQQADIQNRRSSLNEAVGMSQHAMDMAEKNGLRGIESVDAAKAAMYANAQQQVKLIAAGAAASDPAIQARAMEADAMLGQKMAQFAQSSTQKRLAAEHQKIQDAQGWEELKIKKQMADTKEAGAGKGGKPMVPTVANKMTKVMSAMQNLLTMRKLAANTGFWDRVQQSGNQAVPIFGNDEEKAKGNTFDIARVEAMKDIADSSLQAGEMNLIGPLIGSRGQLKSDPVPTIQSNLEAMLKIADTKIRSYRAEGYDVSGLIEQRDEIAREIAAGGAKGAVRK